MGSCAVGKTALPSPATITSPAAGTCCYTPTCADSDGAGKGFDCAADAASATDVTKTAAAAETTVNAKTCCMEPAATSTNTTNDTGGDVDGSVRATAVFAAGVLAAYHM